MRQGAKRLLGVVHQQLQVRLAPVRDDAAFVLVVLALLAAGDGRAVAHQAHQQKRVGEAALLWGDADVDQRVQVEQAHFHIFNAVLLQGDGWPLAVFADAFGADAGVELVFDLQHIGVELLPARAVFHADGLVERVGGVDGGVQRLRVTGQRVEVDMQLGLHIVLVTQVAHAQAGGEGAIQRVGSQWRQVGFAPLQE